MELGSKKKETHPYLDEGGDVARVEDEDERARGQLEADLDAQDQRQGEEQRPPAAVAADATDAADAAARPVGAAASDAAQFDADVVRVAGVAHLVGIAARLPARPPRYKVQKNPQVSPWLQREKKQ